MPGIGAHNVGVQNAFEDVPIRTSQGRVLYHGVQSRDGGGSGHCSKSLVISCPQKITMDDETNALKLKLRTGLGSLDRRVEPKD